MKTSAFVISLIIFAACSSHEKDARLLPAQGFIASLDTANYTTVEWIDSLQNFGTVQEGDTVKLSYTFKNTGDRPLFLSKVHADCGCTVVSFPKEAVLPGHEEKVLVQFSSMHHPGFVSRSFVATSNTNNNSKHTLRMQGNVLKNPGK